jgi:hypothetical protein
VFAELLPKRINKLLELFWREWASPKFSGEEIWTPFFHDNLVLLQQVCGIVSCRSKTAPFAVWPNQSPTVKCLDFSPLF